MAAKATQAAKAAAGKAVKAVQAAKTARATGTASAVTGAAGAADYDAIVVGGGHNGLVAAAYLARSGARTLVLEARPKTGGAATTEAPWPDAPDFRVTRLSYVMSLMPPTIIRDLRLDKHGYKIFPMGPYYQAFPEGGSIKLYADDAKRNHDEISRWSKKDADAMPRWDAWLAGLADVLGPLLLTVPPNLGSHKPRDLAETLRLAWRQRGLDVRTIADVTRLMTMSIADLLDDWFSSPQVKGALAVNGVIGTWAGPYEPGTAYVMAHHSIGDVGDGHLGNWGFQEGGMGAVADAIAGAARENGAEIRTGARVTQLLIKRWPGRRGRPRGRTADHGQGRGHLAAPAHRVPGPRRPPEPARRLRRRHRALEDPQRRRQDQPGAGRTPRLHRRSRHQPGRSTTRVRWRWRRPCRTSSAPSKTRARAGPPPGRSATGSSRPPSTRRCARRAYHIMSLFTQWVPSDWSEEPHTTELQAYADRMIDCYNEVAPNFKSSILHADIVGPYEMEHDYGLVGGNIFHGELSLEQLFHMRPAPGFADYRTPVPGLYYASSATHAGGGVCGIPGMQAARAAMADRRAALRGPAQAVRRARHR